MTNEFGIIYCTVPNKNEAKKISKVLVKEKLAACVNMIGGVESYFSWGGKFCKEKEIMLVIKTQRIHFDKIQYVINQLHTYNVPEIVWVPILEGSEDYLKWIAHETLSK